MTAAAADPIAAALEPAPGHRGLVVAFSGGLDSTVLLHALAQRDACRELRAIHVHHGLQATADDWADHCGQVASGLGISLTIIRVVVDPQDHAGPEAAARNARYTALRGALAPGDLLVTAHHRDDQAETLLLRLLRGTGLRGLAAMAPLAPLPASGPSWSASSRPAGDSGSSDPAMPDADVHHYVRNHTFREGPQDARQGQASEKNPRLWRPFLHLARSELRTYALGHGLDWIEDPQNTDPRYMRSWIRREVMPLLHERFPHADVRFAATATHAAEAEQLLDDLAALDLDLCRCRASDDAALSITAFRHLSAPRRRNLLRHWLRRRALPVPDAATLDRVEREVLDAAPDAKPLLAWPAAELRRYRDAVFAMSPLPAPPPAEWFCIWSEGTTLLLPAGCGRLDASGPPPVPVHVRLAQPGERWRASDTAKSTSLKNRFQDSAVPPWQRTRTAVLNTDDGSRWIPRLRLIACSSGFAEWQPVQDD